MSQPRLAELLVGLSRVADLGFGLPVGAATRSAALAIRLARATGLPDDKVRAACYTALLHHVGCAGFAHESAQLLGDDLAANQAAGRTDPASSRDVLATFLPHLVAGQPPGEQVRRIAAAVARGSRWGQQFTATACEVGRRSAGRLGLGDDVQDSLFHVYDVWKGARGQQLRGDTIPVAARVARLTAIAVLFDADGGPATATAVLRERAGGQLDPGLVDVFCAKGTGWLADLEQGDAAEAVLAEEPAPYVRGDARAAAMLFGDLADLKSPWLLGHSRGVAGLATRAAAGLGLGADVTADLEVAALLHDTGRVAVSSAVWDKPGPLAVHEWEQVRLHPYFSERVLSGSPTLRRLAPLAGRHHERLDGSGYHRGCDATEQTVACRVLAAADVYQAATEPRPYRPAATDTEAADVVGEAVVDGRLDAAAVAAVLAARGQAPGSPAVAANPGGLSDREVEVLRLLARGLSNRQIADRLAISRRTAEHHVQHVYTKLGRSGRAVAALYAAEHGLLGPDG